MEFKLIIIIFKSNDLIVYKHNVAYKQFNYVKSKILYKLM